MLRRRLERGSAEVEIAEVVDAAQLLLMRESVESVSVHEDVLRYVVSLAAATRNHPKLVVGASPRAELDLVQLSRARALLNGRDFVLPEDVKAPPSPPSVTGSPCARRCGCAACTAPTWWSSCCAGCRKSRGRRDRPSRWTTI